MIPAPPLPSATHATTAESLTPPYPNLGPEPWPGGPRRSGWTTAAGAGLLLVVLSFAAAAWVARRRLRTRAHASGGPAESPPPDATDSTPARFIAGSAALRSALVERHGELWRAKTTEEVAPALAAAGADETFIRDLVEFLQVADRAKFADSTAFAPAVDQRGAVDPDAWCATLLGSLAAGARSTISGR